jgi:crotonobetainyl-CoA:carnitine CoA-transferase CaiB-like acyl-CoA transferase
MMRLMTDVPDAKPLSHLRVLDLSRLQPGAFASSLLADLGADVLRIEAPGGADPLRFEAAMNVAYNRGKRSMTLDLRSQRAPDVLRRLVRTADVLIESARPGSMEQRGIGYPQLVEENPRLVWCSITGFGEGSPYSDRPAHDVTLLGHSGLLALLAGDTVPAAPQFIIAVPIGALMATVGVLVALAQRERTGRGTHVDASVVDAASWMIGEHITRVAQGRAAGWGDSASRRTYRCADGRLITLAAAEPRTWKAFCDALGRPDLSDRLMDPDQDALTADLASLFATRTAAEWVASLAPAGACVGPVYEPGDLFDDEHVVARGGVLGIDGSDERVVANPLRFAAAGDAARAFTATSAPVAAGEHTDEALLEVGFTPAEIDDLRAGGAV